MGNLNKGNILRSNNRQIESISNSLIDDNKFNVKKKWLHDNRELSGVGKTIVGITEPNKFESITTGSYNIVDEANLSQSTNKNASNLIVYGEDGKAFGIVSKEIIDILIDPNEELSSKSIAIEQIHTSLQYSESKKLISSYAPIFLKFLFKILEEESSAKILINLLKIIILILTNLDILDKLNIQPMIGVLGTQSNIQVRKLAMQALISIMNKTKQETYLNMLIPYLGSINDRIREAVLHLIIASFLTGDNKFDYITIVDAVAKLLDDPNTNIRFASTEALYALVSKGEKNKVYEILYEIVETKEYNRL